jgi:hypothetical protein
VAAGVVAKEEEEVDPMERRNEFSRPGVEVARALALSEEEANGRPSWLILAAAVLVLLAVGFMRLSPALAAAGGGNTGKPDDPAVTRYDADDDGHDGLHDGDGDDDGTTDGTNGDRTGATGTTGRSDPGSLTDGRGHTGPTGNTGTFTDGNQRTGPTDNTGPRHGTLTDGNHHTGPTGNTVTATDGRG